ncbi:12359_t:CDS:1, partial [Racocetra fulgida]
SRKKLQKESKSKKIYKLLDKSRYQKKITRGIKRVQKESPGELK